jgi:putative membrane-bound dehydrogenase-like protein
MKPWSRPLACLLPLILTAFAAAQVPPDKAVGTMKVADDLQIELFAAEPMLINPTSIDVDHKGRVWVCEAVNYRRVNFNRPLLRPEGDRIVILEDTDGDGKADTATVFYQGKELYGPIGIAVAKDPVGPGYKVFVCQSPDILVFEDREGKGKADGPPKKFLTNFGGFDHDHGVHGIFIGPDGKLWFTVGDQGVKGLQSSDGKGRKWTSNNTDCRAGTVWRCDLDGTNLELIAHNFRNNYEACVDSFGTCFLSDNDDDGNQQTRICYVMPGGNYGYYPRGPGQTHWHEEQPGVVPKILRTGFGSPTGIQVYEGDLLPKRFKGQLLHADAGPREFRAFHLKPNGAGYDCEKEILVTSSDTWWRLSDVCVAPDGSVMLADWYDPGVGGHGMGDWTRGRIYRVTPKGHKGYKVPEVDLTTAKGWLAALGSPNRAVQHMAIRSVRDNAEKFPFRKDLLDTACDANANAELRARALWLVSAYGDFIGDPKQQEIIEPALKKAATDPDPRFRCLFIRLAYDITNKQGLDVLSLVTNPRLEAHNLLVDPSPAVRRELLLSLRNAGATARQPILRLVADYDGKDRFYLCAVGIAVGQDPKRREVILAGFDKEFPEWNDAVADLVWELRPPKMVALLEGKLTDKKLTAAQRARVVDILATSDDKDAGKRLLGLLKTEQTPEVRARVLENLKLFLPTKWQTLRQSPELTQVIDDMLRPSADRTTAVALIEAAGRADLAGKVEEVARDRKADGELRKAAVRALGSLPSDDSVRALIRIRSEEKTLATEAAQALGKLAQGKPEQPGAKSALEALQALALDRQATPEARHDALSALAGTRPGSLWLLALHEKSELPDDLKADTARLLRNSSYQDIRNKANAAFPAVGKINPKNPPAIPTLLKRKGDPERGQRILAASMKGDTQCLKCHTVRGVGGQIGPDLSMIGKKASRENLFESILYPSKAIADQYVNWNIETSKGLFLSGLIVEETPTSILLRDGNGKDTRIDKKDIAERTKNPKSLMPEDIVAYLSEDELVDLVEYLLTLRTASLGVDYWHIVGPFDNGEGDKGLDEVFPPEKAVDLKVTYRGKFGQEGWKVVRPDATGYVDLKAWYGERSPNIVSYCYREIESPAEQEATIVFGHDDGCKLWVNGKEVFVSRDHKAATPDQARVTVKLSEGVNRVLFKINNGDGPHGFYMTILTEQELKRGN